MQEKLEEYYEELEAKIDWNAELLTLNTSFPKLRFDFIPGDSTDEARPRIIAKGFLGNPEYQLRAMSAKELNQLKHMPLDEIVPLNEVAGFYFGDAIQLALRTVSPPRPYRHLVEPFTAKMNYKGSELNITLETIPPLLEDFLRLSERVRHFGSRASITISGYKYKSPEELFDDVRSITNSFLFDFGTIYDMLFEPLSIESTRRRRLVRAKRESPSGVNTVFTFKKYIPELIEYFKTAERVDYLPFNYLCYYYILEYFMDRSAQHAVAERVKSLLLKPDFHLNRDTYISKTIDIFKKESEKNLSDKEKVKRVLEQFIDREELLAHLADIGIAAHFENELVMKCGKDLTLKKIDFSSDSAFLTTAVSRIYSLRCSIVHSNPDFDPSKAIPFLASLDNIEKLSVEILLIKALAKTIVLGSAS